MKSFEIHPKFRLNGKRKNQDELCHMAFNLIRDGEPYQHDLGRLILQWFDDNSYVVLRTSGTTGEPKEIKIEKKAMINSAKATGAFFDLEAGDRALLCLPTRFIAGKMMFIRAMVLGLKLDFVPLSSTPLFGNQIKYDFVAMVPLQVENSLEELKNIRKIIIGGSQVNPALIDKLKKIPSEIYETYGMTETITHIAARKIGDDYFKLLPHVHIEKDDRGCLVIDVPKISKEKIITNDMVDIIDDTQFQWMGRIDNVVNSGGIKLFPERIEERLANYIPYRFFVIGKEDKLLGEKLILVIESEPYELREEIFNSLSKYEKPKEIQFVREFIETPTGKIMRKQNLK